MKRIKSEIFVIDPLPASTTTPIYDCEIGQDVLFLDSELRAQKITPDSYFKVPLISLDEPFEKTYKNRKVNSKLDKALDSLIETLFGYPKVKKIKATTYLDAHNKAAMLLPENTVGGIFVNDENKELRLSTRAVAEHYDFERRLFSVPFLSEHTLLFIPDPEYFGVMPVSLDDLSCGAAILAPHSAVIVQCESVS